MDYFFFTFMRNSCRNIVNQEKTLCLIVVVFCNNETIYVGEKNTPYSLIDPPFEDKTEINK